LRDHDGPAKNLENAPEVPTMTRCQIVLPARLASTRLPEKLLRRVGGKSILQHTYDSAKQSRVAEAIVVAVDDPRMAREVESFGGEWMMTSPACASGTDRIAEVARARPEIDVFVNVQADEPEIDPQVIDQVAMELIHDTGADMATAATPLRELELLNDPACVKVVMAQVHSTIAESHRGRAVYFSRAVVPFVREGITPRHLEAEPPLFWHHIGLYAYRRDFLNWFAAAPPSLLEQAEKLEQLRAIEAGKRIMVTRVASAASGIDTQSDLDAFTRRFASSMRSKS
jgi:3-deoxy-manno-octulosonate cytidylyltransferase (CMP-KDO synthetase)